ncbi:cilia- and flagella-associated protein 157 [Protobothrops mucrosquamatus]|uniref:cilia- and flagella-associated protein 157 n=1 Tax=Protobothrops mucrosquamatus TaxID=103944 RepID=UPI000775DFC9|nr:cilia- and flagella-associated protein 157 [Protobothrops mucrosquamatus]
MAPKKRGRKKEEAPKEQEVDDSIVPEHSREFYLIQIRDLEGRLARYQQKWDQLQVSEELFRCEYDKMLTDNKEIVAFLKKTLNQRVDEIADLTLQLQNLQQAKDLEKDAFETQLVQLRHEFQETKDQLTSENMVLSGKLAALEEFRLQKDEILAKFAERENQLRKEEEQHKDVIYNLERKAVIDKERMKKDMLHRVNAVAAEFRKVANNQMAETTKRTIRENVAISLQLTKVTEQSLQLIQENDRLKAAHAEATKQLQLLEQNEKKMVKNSLGHQKMIWMLTEKCKELQSELEEQRKTKAHLAKVQKSSETLFQQNLVLRVLPSMIPFLSAQERPLPEEEDRDFDVMFQLRRRNALQGILHFVQRGVTRLDAQQGLHPVAIESKVVKVTNLSRSFSTEWHTKASRTTSHCNIFQLPKPVHSLPSLESVSSAQLVSIRPYSSANESISSWRAENNGQGSPPARSAVHVPAEGGQGSEEVAIREDLPEIVSHLARQELLSK